MKDKLFDALGNEIAPGLYYDEKIDVPYRIKKDKNFTMRSHLSLIDHQPSPEDTRSLMPLDGTKITELVKEWESDPQKRFSAKINFVQSYSRR